MFHHDYNKSLVIAEWHNYKVKYLRHNRRLEKFWPLKGARKTKHSLAFYSDKYAMLEKAGLHNYCTLQAILAGTVARPT